LQWLIEYNTQRQQQCVGFNPMNTYRTPTSIGMGPDHRHRCVRVHCDSFLSCTASRHGHQPSSSSSSSSSWLQVITGMSQKRTSTGEKPRWGRGRDGDSLHPVINSRGRAGVDTHMKYVFNIHKFAVLHKFKFENNDFNLQSVLKGGHLEKKRDTFSERTCFSFMSWQTHFIIRLFSHVVRQGRHNAFTFLFFQCLLWKCVD